MLNLWLWALPVLGIVTGEDIPATKPQRLVRESFTYTSSVDQTGPLHADIAFVEGAERLPLVVVMHGYYGSRKAVSLDLKELAGKGVVALAPDMRGCGDSAGKWDSGGLDVHDIVDGVLEAIQQYPGVIDARRLNVIGYSGGGGNAISCMVRFPDLFQNYVSFFGIADYGGWHASQGRPDCNVQMEKALGGSPEAQPDVYLSRNAIPAARNLVGLGRPHFFWDATETMCPPSMVEAFINSYQSAGGEGALIHVSQPEDSRRWIHNYRGGNKDLSHADELFLPDVLADARKLRLPRKGEMVVAGYLVTRDFQVWVEDGQKGAVTIEYELDQHTPSIKVRDHPGNWKVTIRLDSPLAKLP